MFIIEALQLQGCGNHKRSSLHSVGQCTSRSEALHMATFYHFNHNEGGPEIERWCYWRGDWEWWRIELCFEGHEWGAELCFEVWVSAVQSSGSEAFRGCRAIPLGYFGLSSGCDLFRTAYYLSDFGAFNLRAWLTKFAGYWSLCEVAFSSYGCYSATAPFCSTMRFKTLYIASTVSECGRWCCKARWFGGMWCKIIEQLIVK